MKKSIILNNQLANRVLLALLVGAFLMIASSTILAQGGNSAAKRQGSKIAAIDFQQRTHTSASTMVRVREASTYFAGLALLSFLVSAHARAVLRKNAQT